eukprot:scaffold12285_cov136-Isochrysis_galbana.AAC.2
MDDAMVRAKKSNMRAKHSNGQAGQCKDGVPRRAAELAGAAATRVPSSFARLTRGAGFLASRRTPTCVPARAV